MASISGSFQLSQLVSSRFASRTRSSRLTHKAAAAADNIADSIVDLAETAAKAAEATSTIPAVEHAAKWIALLKRPANSARTAADELTEERLNALTHGLGLAFATIGAVHLVQMALFGGNAMRLLGCGVYGASLVLMYAASTTLHATQCPQLKKRCQAADHISIYLLIAGTYTPFMLGVLPGRLGWTLLACVWTLAGIGIWIKLQNADRLDETSPLPYVGLGWLAIAAIKPLASAMPIGGTVLLIGGGVIYSLGVVFFARDDKKYFHAVWHLFVIAGSACHFFAILSYVAV